MSVLTQYGVSYAQAAQEDRCAPRAQVQIAAKLRRSSEAAFNVQVLDLSCAGFSCEAVTSIKPGTICWLSLPGLSGMQAEVVWNDGTTVGCAFATLMNQSVVDRLISLYPVPSASQWPNRYSSSR